MRNGRTIKSDIAVVFSLISVVTLAGYAVSFYMRTETIRRFELYFANMEMLSSLSGHIQDLPIAFERFTRDADPSYIATHAETSRRIEELIGHLETELSNVDSARPYVSNLANMVQYERELVIRIAESSATGETSFSEMAYLRSFYQYMNRHAQSLIAAYVASSGEFQEALLKRTRKLELSFHIVALAITSLVVWAGLLILQKAIHNLRDVVQVAERLSSADWSVPDLPSMRYGELDAVGIAFNSMKRSIQAQLREIAEKRLIEQQLAEARLAAVQRENLLKDARLESLESKINPHFLFNTLNLIKRMIQRNRAESTAKLVDSISVILRASLDHREHVIEISTEMKMLKAYITIQEARFQGRISFDLRVDESLLGFLLPPLTLQPLVENSIVHGLKDTKQNGSVSIDIFHENASVMICVRDNGRGFSDESVERFASRVCASRGGQVGLENVRSRLELQYGMKDVMTLGNDPCGGAFVRIKLPTERGRS